MSNTINWFEIPVKNFEQAQKFYETIFDIQLIVIEDPMKMGMFPTDCQKEEVGGAIVTGEEGHQPSDKGTVVYFHGGEDLGRVLDKVEDAGGQVLMPKTKIPMEDAGFMALVLDTEGNKIGLHSMK